MTSARTCTRKVGKRFPGEPRRGGEASEDARLRPARNAVATVRGLQVSSLMANDLIHKAVGWMLREMGKESPEALDEDVTRG